ncbi:MAG: hypothetical protein H6658_12590 [Ardenticatenaceae bacterium]|nr:hypothetical protein [Ardenticatenaceae bacterium]
MNQPQRATLMGVLLTSLAILTLEIVFTRVFSVLMWYHFAFMVISLALLGSGAAGVWLYLADGRFPPAKINERLTLLALLFAFGTIAAFLLYLQIPFEFKTISKEGLHWQTVGWLALIYLVLSIPFLLGGATIALAISRFSRDVGQVYFYDLIGASLGCLLSVLALTVMGAGSAVLLVSVMGGVAALLFAWATPQRGWRWLSGLTVLLLLGVLLSNLSGQWLQVRTRGGYDAKNVMVYEKWNALARVTVYEDPYWLQPFGWGLSPTYVGPDPGHLMLLIDANAGTPIQKWDGSWAMVDFLRYDLTSLAYHILPQANTFVIGTGGGRDILTGLLFGANSITGAELNPAIVTAARDTFGDYAGRVYDYPNVHVEIEDARTYLSRTGQQFDLIQASLIDTWAASSSGAYSLSENGLYTQEAFLTFYGRLTDRGMVSYSRWYFIADPTESLRMVALGRASWEAAGVTNVGDHMVVIANFTQNRSADKGLATMLLKRTPFTPEEVATLAELSQELEFTVLHAPGYEAIANPVHDLMVTPNLDEAIAQYPLDISVPTDNRPFFFDFASYSTLGNAAFQDNPAYTSSAEANYALLAVLAISAVTAVLFILLPLAARRQRTAIMAGQWPTLLYFAALGIGFMLVMVPSIQRLTVYLGSPTYALAVGLFTILLSSGIGSRTTHSLEPADVQRRLRLVIIALIIVIALHLLIIPPLVQATQSWLFGWRIALVILLIFPAGFLMGQPFPLGMKWVSSHTPAIVPWLWAVNGATSVIGSAMATIVGLAVGFRMVSLVGMACYGLALAVALLAWARASRDVAVVTLPV